MNNKTYWQRQKNRCFRDVTAYNINMSCYYDEN